MPNIENLLTGTIIANSKNFTSGRTGGAIKYIVIHYTANNGDTASGNCNYFNSGSRGASAHYFIDENNIYRSVLDSNTAWHCGANSYKHSVCRNNNAIGIEMCSRQDSSGKYYIKDEVIEKTIALTKLLMKKYNIPIENILRHYDVTGKICPAPFVENTQLWTNFKNNLNSSNYLPEETTSDTSEEKVIWNFLKNKNLNNFSIAGIMGNLYAESSLRSNNLQNTFEKSLNMSDVVYTSSVDKNTYTNFVNDKAGYGLAQWTYYTRKQKLLNFALANDTSISDLNMQLNFLWAELQDYKNVINVLHSAKTIKEASDIFLLEFEKPANQGEEVKAKRLEYSQIYFNKYSEYLEYSVQVTADSLNYRSGAGTNFPVLGKITDKGRYTIIEESTGTGASNWGKLKSGAGWISLDFVKKI